MRSIQNVYLGDYDGSSGLGLSEIVAELDSDLDATIKAQITDAINKIEAIPGTFTEAIFDNRTEVEAAQTAVTDLQAALESDLKPLIQGL